MEAGATSHLKAFPLLFTFEVEHGFGRALFPPRGFSLSYEFKMSNVSHQDASSRGGFECPRLFPDPPPNSSGKDSILPFPDFDQEKRLSLSILLNKMISPPVFELVTLTFT